jgi:ABC-type transporter Mla subunit MlaD
MAFVAAAIALIPVFNQLRKTAAQVERTMTTLDQSIPALVSTADEARNVLASLEKVVARADHIVGDFETVGGKAARLSSIVVDQVLAPAGQMAALVSGVRTGVSYLFDGWLNRRQARVPSTGGNHHE